MFWDIYARHIFILPSSGNDTEGFYRSAIFVANNIGLIGEKIYG
ncbi:MAG TPA: hypothetical protein VK071_13730 [Tissierellales bacterium]|nr:hypothetical protein [Tissierellales bacterium]